MSMAKHTSSCQMILESVDASVKLLKFHSICVQVRVQVQLVFHVGHCLRAFQKLVKVKVSGE